MEDHDQRFKALLPEFLGQFFALFFPEWLDRFDWSSAVPEPTEALINPVTGEKRNLDLVFTVKTRMPVHDSEGTERNNWVVIIHIEVESPESSTKMGRRMHEYRNYLSGHYNYSVFQVCLFLKVGKDGIGWEEYTERLWDKQLQWTQYAYVGLPALDGLEYLARPEILAVALSALMKIPESERLRVKLEGLARIARSGENDARKHLLADCLETYLKLSPEQQDEFTRISSTIRDEGTIMVNRWEEKGAHRARGEFARSLLENKFGPLPEVANRQIGAMTDTELQSLGIALLRANSLAELGLGEVIAEATN